MGLLDSIIPTVIGAVTGGPVGASAAFIGSQRQQRETKRQKALIEERRQQEKRFMDHGPLKVF